MTGHYTYRLTEEIARWAFEIHIQSCKDWVIAFTNPTAGPWKRLTGLDKNGTTGEVHRFEREEDRPDLVLVSDRNKIIIIIEAKDLIQKLTAEAQIVKSVAVIHSLAKILRTKADNSFWENRSDYMIIAGLLWGAEIKSTDAERRAIFSAYKKALSFNKTENLATLILGIESYRDADSISCGAYLSENGRLNGGLTAAELLASLRLKPKS